MLRKHSSRDRGGDADRSRRGRPPIGAAAGRLGGVLSLTSAALAHGWAVKKLAALAANPLESTLRAIGEDVPGLDLRPQVTISDGDFAVRPDLVDQRLRVVAEADSFQWVLIAVVALAELLSKAAPPRASAA